jgi:hypothetical protein
MKKITIDIDDLPTDTPEARAFKTDVQSAAELQELAYHERRAAKLRSIREAGRGKPKGLIAPAYSESEAYYGAVEQKPEVSYRDQSTKKRRGKLIGEIGTVVVAENEPELSDEEQRLASKKPKSPAWINPANVQSERAGDPGSVDVGGIRMPSRRRR